MSCFDVGEDPKPKLMSPELIQAVLADMLNTMHQRGLKARAQAPFSFKYHGPHGPGEVFACCAVGALALESCPTITDGYDGHVNANSKAYKCANDALRAHGVELDSANLMAPLWRAFDHYPVFTDSASRPDLAELGYLFAEAMDEDNRNAAFGCGSKAYADSVTPP